jgi:hypothetical protein
MIPFAPASDHALAIAYMVSSAPRPDCMMGTIYVADASTSAGNEHHLPVNPQLSIVWIDCRVDVPMHALGELIRSSKCVWVHRLNRNRGADWDDWAARGTQFVMFLVLLECLEAIYSRTIPAHLLESYRTRGCMDLLLTRCFLGRSHRRSEMTNSQ